MNTVIHVWYHVNLKLFFIGKLHMHPMGHELMTLPSIPIIMGEGNASWAIAHYLSV